MVLENLRPKSESKLTDYDSASWAYKAADKAGYNRALKDVIRFLINTPDKEDK